MSTPEKEGIGGVRRQWVCPLVLGLVVASGITMYVVNDGFYLGLGILFPAAPGRAERDVMMNSIAPIWDGNETWLVLGGTLLIGGFPLAYGALLPAFYCADRGIGVRPNFSRSRLRIPFSRSALR
jgi:cytochrome bd-type quinol oxidase subunit 2